MKTYNGYTNYETWNVSLWILNDEELYNLAVKSVDYADFVRIAEMKGYKKTKDRVDFLDTDLNTTELDKVIRELI